MSFPGSFPTTARPRVWGVAALLNAVGDSLIARFGLCAVRGEVSGWSRAGSGHCYFQLKDGQGAAAGLRCVMFRRVADALTTRVGDGMKVELQGRLGLYEPRGELQFVVESVQLGGAGSLYEQFLKLKERLAAEGLFAAERKRPLVARPRALGVVTSPVAAALHDVVAALRRRAPHIPVVIYPCAVQGSEAPSQIVEALDCAARRREVDTLIVCRGGGSIEDLWAFNDERVVRAIVSSPIPVVCGVGHETDLSLADFAADLRAPTPTAAAELVATPLDDLADRLLQLQAHMRARLTRTVQMSEQRLDRANLRLLRPGQVVARRSHALGALQQRWGASARLALAGRAQELMAAQGAWSHAVKRPPELARLKADRLQSRLEALDPKRVLERGYAWLETPDRVPVCRAAQARAGDRMTAILADGALVIDVHAVRADKPRA